MGRYGGEKAVALDLDRGFEGLRLSPGEGPSPFPSPLVTRTLLDSARAQREVRFNGRFSGELQVPPNLYLGSVGGFRTFRPVAERKQSACWRYACAMASTYPTAVKTRWT